MIIIEVGGNLQSLKVSTIKEIEQLYEYTVERDQFISVELAEKMSFLSSIINREISIYIDRKGKVTDVRVGDDKTVTLTEPEGKRNPNRLSGIRCIHTHPGGNSQLSEIDIHTLYMLKLDAMAAIGIRNEKITGLSVALPIIEDTDINKARENGLTPASQGIFELKAEIIGPMGITDCKINNIMELIVEKDRQSLRVQDDNSVNKDRAILVGIELPESKIIGGINESVISIDELEELTLTAGGEVVTKIIQKKKSRDSAFLVGKGKIEEINLISQGTGANLIIFDSELSGAQVKNIEALTGVRVLDRTNLILDIFAQRARSSEGKLQVELAQLRYSLPRLMGLGAQLSRLGGGIGTRGPGEKKLETDRRHIRRRIDYLEQQLEKIKKQRSTMRKSREKNDIPTFALVGYTNAGKSTLLNKICQSDVYAENKLFATLDPTTRKFEIAQNKQALMTDTVGFIRNLPHHLVEAFKSTLEEALFADILLHVVDKSNEQASNHIEVVEKILNDLGAEEKITILVLNKADIDESKSNIVRTEGYNHVFEISSLTGEGLEQLVECMRSLVKDSEIRLELLVPYSEGWVEAYVHKNGVIYDKSYEPEGTKLIGIIKSDFYNRIEKFNTAK